MIGQKRVKHYQAWLTSKIDQECEDGSTLASSYKLLLRQLFTTEFYWRNPLDANREADGIDLRSRYIYEEELPRVQTMRILDGSCSVLEMMVALSLRCEETIMADDDLGDRTGFWFWNMVKSLGLMKYTDDIYDEEAVDNVLIRFMDRDYKRDGQGGLYYVPNPSKDMRRLDIWYQMHMFLNRLTE